MFKAILAVATLLVSFHASADGVMPLPSAGQNWIPAAQGDLIKQALNAEMNNRTFACTSSTNTWKTVPDMMTAAKGLVTSAGVSVFTSADRSQPAIKVVWKSSDSTLESNLVVMTTPDFVHITNFQAKQEALSYTTVNVGTLLDPVFAQQEVRKLNMELTCIAQ